jgi:CTP synthase (UTP-ammonia lyase)
MQNPKRASNMEKRIKIGLVGDFDKKIVNHLAINESVIHAKPHLHFELETTWVPTETITENFLAQQNFNGFWVVPGSPYKNDEGVYKLIRWARENDFPLFGTCGGFQYMVVEYAKNVLGFRNAGHEESEPQVEQLVISKLACSLKATEEEVMITDKHSWLFQTLQKEKITGRFNCSYGLNPKFQPLIDQYPMVFTAFSAGGEARALELKGHRFYAATLFQPPLESTAENPNPLLISFFKKCSHD